MKNLAYIDGQNLHIGTKSADLPWNVDLKRFRTYLSDKYHVTRAYYFLGFYKKENSKLYEGIQKAGFVLKFRKHGRAMVGKKKGNVDSDIIFNVMDKIHSRADFERIVMVSGDGDYKMLVDHLIKNRKFEKILFPNKKYASSLYNSIGSEYFDYLENLRKAIE